MNTKISWKRISLTVALIVAVLVPVLHAQVGTLPATTGDSAYNVFRFPGLPTSIAATSASNSTAGHFTSSAMTLQMNQPLTIWWGIQGSNGSASNGVVTFRIGYGGTVASNYATTPVITVTNTANGTNQINQVYYIPASNLYGARTIIPWQIANTNTNVLNIGPLIGSQFRVFNQNSF